MPVRSEHWSLSKRWCLILLEQCRRQSSVQRLIARFRFHIARTVFCASAVAFGRSRGTCHWQKAWISPLFLSSSVKSMAVLVLYWWFARPWMRGPSDRKFRAMENIQPRWRVRLKQGRTIDQRSRHIRLTRPPPVYSKNPTGKSMKKRIISSIESLLRFVVQRPAEEFFYSFVIHFRYLKTARTEPSRDNIRSRRVVVVFEILVLSDIRRCVNKCINRPSITVPLDGRNQHNRQRYHKTTMERSPIDWVLVRCFVYLN